jgi:hypothetical protein
MRESIRHTVPSYPIDCRRVMFRLVSRAQALFVIGSALTVAVFFLALWLLPEQPFLFSNKLLRCSDLTSGFYRRLTFVYGARWNNSHAALHNGRVRFGSGSAFTRVPMLKLDGLGPSHQSWRSQRMEPRERVLPRGSPFFHTHCFNLARNPKPVRA